jgi:integrase
MSKDDHQNWHRIEGSDDSGLTVRHPGSHFETLKTWAEQHDVSEIFEAIALTFGFTENFTIIGNLSRALSDSDSQAILTQWADNPYIYQLNRLIMTYNQGIDISSAFAGIPQGVSRANTKTILRAAGADIKHQHFLLEMIVQPLALFGSESLDRLRKTLRIWLIVQALERTVEHSCYHDNQIQQVASALCLSAQDDKWGAIDSALTTSWQACPSDHYSYGQFTLAIRHAAIQVLPLYSEPDQRKKRLLLNSLQRVAEGQRNQIVTHRTGRLSESSFSGLFKNTAPSLTLDKQTGAPQVLTLSDSDSGSPDEDGLEQLILFDVNPQETPEQQQLSGRSILLQTAELSHYLPWSWDKLLPPETQLLEQWLTSTLAHDELPEQLGAALVWLALRFGRSLEFVLEFQITDDAQAEWSLSSDFESAHRQTPRRHSSWAPDKADETLIEPFEKSLCTALPERIQEILRQASRSYQESSSLRRLWGRAFPDNLQTWFRQHARQHFPRLSSAKLANAQPQRVFDEQGDHSLARLISAHPRSALPAACGYANWDIPQVQNGFALPLEHSSGREERVNLLGSLLAPLESVLVEGVRKGTRKLLDSAKGDPVTFHNTLVQYTVTALYAATGCRHLSEPFESLSHFCNEPPTVFINDKTEDGLHSGRMVPLANGARALVSAYCEHLRHLQKGLANQDAELSGRIDQVLQGASNSLPLFFFLDSSGLWHSLSDETVQGAGLFQWSLPKNLFRHRFSQQLARCGVNPEVIDGWMGHGERGATTYSDHSARCWKEDAERYHQTLNDCFDRLGFLIQLPETTYDEIQVQPRSQTDDYREPTHFGQAKRHLERLQARDQARALARKDLDLILKANPPNGDEQLTQTYVDGVVKGMLLRENGLPHPRAAIRMEVLIQWLESSGPQARQFVRHRLARLGTERSLFRSSCPRALQVMPELQRWASQTRHALRQRRLSKSDGLALAVAFLVIEKRISYPQLLSDLVQGLNYRVIQHKRRVYLEYSEALEPDNFDQPVQRHEIDHTTARLLARGSGIKDTKDLTRTPCPRPLRSLQPILKTSGPEHWKRQADLTLAEVLKSLHRLVEQANLVDFPGIVAGALSERNPPTSVCLYDYLRLIEGLRYQIPGTDTSAPLSAPEALPNIPAMASASYPNAFYDSSKAFFRALHDILNRYTKSTSQEIARTIERHCKSSAHGVSSAVLMLGYWIAHRVRRGKGRPNRTHKPYAASSIKRYLSALSPSFGGLAYNADLMIMTDEDVTELCARMLSRHAEKQKDLDYFSARLIEFFDWAGERGVSAPDWDELDLGGSRRSVRPRLFSEDEYLEALRILLRADSEDPNRGRQAAFVLFLAFRFGLRAQEALGLLRSDWCQSGELTWVLVQGNAIRSLKNTTNSRRAIPLLFQLDATEQTLIETTLTRYTTRFADVTNKPILGADDGALTPFARSIPTDIAKALKLATGNPRMSLHQARHSFCNVLTTALFGIHTPLAANLCKSIDREAIIHVMLGKHEQPSRRGAMAIGRALGHQSPRTQFRSYNHLLTEWADTLTPVSSHYSSSIAKAIDTSEWAVESLPDHDAFPTIFSQKAELTPAIVIEALRLMALGYPTNRIEYLLRLEPGELTDVETLVDRVNAGIRFKIFDPERGKKAYVYGQSLPRFLLKSRPSGVWPRLLELAEKLPPRNQLANSRPLPSLEQASNLVGRNGHLLMNLPEEAYLLRLVVDSFKLPETSFMVMIKSPPSAVPRAQNLLLEAQFAPAAGVTTQLDTFNEDHSKTFGRARSYAGLVLAKPATGPLHDNLELVLAYIAIAAAYCPRTGPMQPLADSQPIYSSLN